MKNLAAFKTYTITWLTEDKTIRKTGQELMQNGLTFSELEEEDSAILHIQS